MNSATAARIRKFKTTDGAYIWQPGLISGSALMGIGNAIVNVLIG